MSGEYALPRAYRDYPLLMRLMGVLLEGKTGVLELLAENPFPHASPCYVSARRGDYRFANPAQHQAGQWQQRREKGLYCPLVETRGR